jgi:uncharacterized iron-regulated membrane protein
MPLEIDLLPFLFSITVGGMAVLSVYAWWSGESRETVLYYVFFSLSYFFIFISMYGVKIFGLPEQTIAIAVGLEVVFMIGTLYFIWKRYFGGGTTRDTA